MNQKTAEELFDAFVADGNEIIGSLPKQFNGHFSLSWRGSGSRIKFGSGVTLTSLRLNFLSGGGVMHFENDTTIRGRIEVSRGGLVYVGEKTFFNRNCDIRGGEGASVKIGSGCLFSDVTAQTSDMHTVFNLQTGKRENPAASIVIEDRVWIAEQVRVGKGARIGTGAVIAAGSLVTRPIPPFCVAGGRPAKVLKTGVSWKRSLDKVPPLPAAEFSAEEIPMEKETLRLLMKRHEYTLVEAIVLSADQADLPLFARWYLVSAKHKLSRPHPDTVNILHQILMEAPNHKAAQALLDQITTSNSS